LPGHRVHRYVDRKLFGRSYWKIHVKMDAPWLLLGRTHRVLFHDHATAVAIAQEYYPNDPNAALSASHHIFIDQLCSNDPVFKAQLEFLADKDARERARIRKEKRNGKKKRKRSNATSKKKRKRRSKDPVKEFADLLEKMKMLQYMARELSK